MGKDPELPDISFIVPTLNEEEYLEDCLNSIEVQNCSKEIIVVDGGSKDGTLEIAERTADKIIEDVKGRGLARDKGAEAAEKEILAFVDADTVLKKEFSTEVVRFMEENSLEACATKFRMTGMRSKLVQGLSNRIFPLMNPVLPGFNTVVRRSAYENSRGFENISNEDIQFSREISKKGEIDIHPEKLVVNSGRRIRKYGLTGVLIYYTWKDMRRRKNNLVSAI